MRLLFSVLFVFVGSFMIGQNMSPVDWTFDVKELSDETLEFTAKADIKGKWAIYSQHTDDGGPVALSFDYENQTSLVGETEEKSEVIKIYSELFEVDVMKFKNEAIFTQKFKASDNLKSFKGSLRFMACDEDKCLPPTVVEFDVPL